MIMKSFSKLVFLLLELVFLLLELDAEILSLLIDLDQSEDLGVKLGPVVRIDFGLHMDYLGTQSC